MQPVKQDDIKAKVSALESAMLEAPQVDCPVKHYFSAGMYAREITIPKGTCLVGVVHKMDNLAVLSSGTLLLATENGPVEISAPATIQVKAGAKNAAIALETAVWTNFLPNPTDERDTDKLVEIYTESKASDLLGGSTNKQLAANKAAELKEKESCHLQRRQSQSAAR